MCDKRRVVITGLGVISPIGLDETTFWRSLMEGRHGIRPVTAIDVSGYKSKLGAEVNNGELDAALAARNWRSMDRAVDMGLLAAVQALEGAGVLGKDGRSSMPGIPAIIGSCCGPSLSLEDTYTRFVKGGLRGMRPTSAVRSMGNLISSQISIKFGLTGANYTIDSACASSVNAIGVAFRMIRDGYADYALCGGAETFFTPTLYAVWERLGVMSPATDPNRACLPFDVERSGFVLGEGAGMLVLEARDAARKRGVRQRAELIGYGESSDANHITRPNEEGQARAIAAALDDAGVGPRDIGFINAHGTATDANDSCEAQSIRRVFGDAADDVPVASNKSYFGHMLGAAGVVETISVVLGLETGRVPPNLNLENPNPACKLRLVSGGPLEVVSPLAMKNSFGFGGDNGVLVLRRTEASA
jgi:3-oxoacyl-[acyl-carrier-protein] synthase II